MDDSRYRFASVWLHVSARVYSCHTPSLIPEQQIWTYVKINISKLLCINSHIQKRLDAV